MASYSNFLFAGVAGRGTIIEAIAWSVSHAASVGSGFPFGSSVAVPLWLLGRSSQTASHVSANQAGAGARVHFRVGLCPHHVPDREEGPDAEEWPSHACRQGPGATSGHVGSGGKARRADVDHQHTHQRQPHTLRRKWRVDQEEEVVPAYTGWHEQQHHGNS